MQRDDRSRDPEGSGSRRRWYESRDRDLTPRAGDQGDSPHSRSYSRQQPPYQQQQPQSPTQQRQYDPQRQDQFQIYQQSPQQNSVSTPRPQQYQYQYPYQNQYHQQQQPYYSAPSQSMPGYNSPYQQQQNPQRPQTPSSVFSSSSDTSTSLLDISRFKDTKEYGGLLGTFFKAPSERVKQRLHRKKSKKRRVLYFGNSSSSSVNSDLAYGNGYVRQPKSRTLSPRSQSRVSGQGYGSAAGVGPGPSNGRRRSSGGSDRAARLTPKKKKTADEEIMALGQQLSNLARLSKEDEQRQARKASGKGKGKAAALGLAAGAAGAAMASQYGQEKNGRMVNGLKQRVQSSDDEDEWEDASEDEDDDSSSSDGAGSAADSELAYGTVAESIKPALGAAAAAGSAAAAAGMAGPRRQSGYGYDSSPEYRRHGDRGSVVDPRLFGPYNSLRGSINTPCGFRNDDEAVAYRRDSANFGNGTPIHMRDMHSDPNRYDGERFSAPIAQQDPSARPAPVPLQQPVPKTPISSKVYDAVKVDGANRRSHSQRRSEQPEEKDWSGVATGGLAAAAAAAAAAGVAMTTSSKKDSREHRDEQQRDRDDRENQRRIDRDRQRALELEEQKLRELERQKLREQHRAQNPESEADRHERLEKERARNMKWEREYREMEPEAIIPNYNNERKSSRYNDDTPKDRSEKKEKSNVDVVVAPKSDQNEGRPFGIQYGPEFQLEREPTVQAGTSERKATRNGRDLPLATGAGHRAVTESAKSAHQDIDPFQYQVSDDAFTMSQTTTPGRPLTPNVVTIEREPNFDDSPPRDSAADVRLSRRDSFEIQRMVEDYRESQGASQRRDPRNGHEYEEEEHKARSILDEAKHATIPVAAAAVASAVAVENERSQERRKGRYSEDSSQDTSRRRKDVVQEEADRYYRETNIARKIASDEMRSRSASPERSVVDRWQESKNESFSIVTPPVMEDKHPEKNIYEGPDADVKIDNKIHPREEHQYRNPDENPSRRNVSRERPLLNLIYPTPAVSRQHTPAPEARKEPEVTEVVAKPEDFSIGPKGEIISVSEPASAAKSVSWGENETKRFDADSPEKSDNDNYFPSEKAVEKSRPKLNKASRWGILAAALAGSSAEPQNEPDVEVDPKQTEMPGGYSYSDAGSSDVSIRRAEFYVDDMNSFPPVVGTKPASPQQMPGRFADDFEFAATLAAGLKDTGFNPDIVIDDPSYSRRDSPPGVQEANGDSHSGSNGNAWYKRPYAEVAPEPVDAPKLLPERGFVLGEVETPQEKTALPYESERNIRSDAPKPEDVPLPNNQSDSPRPSKQEQRKREKSDVVVVQDDGKIETGRAEPEPSREAGEAVWEDISRKKSNKGRKKDRKGRDFEDEWSPSVSAPAPYESRSDYDRSISQDQGRDHDISVSDVAKVAVPAALALGAIASGSRDASSRDIRTDMSDSPAELRKQPNDDYYYDGDRSRVSAPAEPSHHRHSSRDVASLDIRSDDEHNSSKHLRKHKKDRESRDEGRYRESSTLEPNDRRSSRRESSRDRSRDRSRHRSSDRRSRDHSRDHRSRDRSRDRRSRDHRSKDRSRDRTRDRSRDRTRDSSRDRSHRRRSDDEEERPKRSKRHPYEYDSPTQSMAASEISVASSSSKRSKKSKRRNDAGDDYNDSRDSPSHRRHESFDDRDASSVVSESRGHRRTPSRYDDDDAKSVSSVPGSSRREKDYKERRTPEKRPSTSVLSGLFKPRKDKKDSFLGNADTLGAGVGLATAADIYASDATRSNAADAPSDREPSASGDGLRHVRSFELVDPEVIPRVIKPAIDPQYGDLLPLPPSEPSSPTSSVSGELPPLPDSRPDTPPEERGARREPWPQQRRRSIFETPMKSPSRTAVPIALRLGNRSSNPASPVSYRASPASSPIISHSDAVVMSRRQARPTSWDNSREFMPLYLLEQSRHPAPTTGSVLPALPPSEPSETSARNSPESEFLKQNDDYFGEDPEYAGPDLRVDTVLSEQQKDSDAESQQTTPRAEFMPVLPEPTPSVPSNEPTPGLSEPKLPEPTPTAAPDPPTPSLATPMESGSRDVASDERSAPPFDAAAIAVPVGLGASAGLAAAALIQVRDRAEPPAEKPDDLTSADEHFSDAVVGPSEPTSPGENISRSLSFAMDREPTSESIAKSPYEPSSETTTGAFTTPVNELVADGLSDVTSHAELAAKRTVAEEAEDQAAKDISDVVDAAQSPSTIPINEHTTEERVHAKPDTDPANEAAKEIEEPLTKEVGLIDKSATEPIIIPVDERATEVPATVKPDTELTAEETMDNQAEGQVARDIRNVGETAKGTVVTPVSEPTVHEPLNAPSNAELLAEKANEKIITAADVIDTSTETFTAPANEPTIEESTVQEPLNDTTNEKVPDTTTDAIGHSTKSVVVPANEPTAEEPTNIKYGAEPVVDEATAKESEDQAVTEAETATQAEAEEVAKEEEEIAALKSKKAKKLTKAEKTRLMTLISHSVKRAQAKAAETTPGPDTKSIAEPSVEEPVVEECAETQESTIEDGTTSAKDLVPEAPENIQEPESTKQIIEPTPIDMAAEEPSRDLTTEPMIEDVTTVAPESSPQPTKELVAEPWADFIPEAVEPADELENEAAGQGAVDLPKSSDEPDTMPQRELVVENVSVTEPRIENTKEETEDLGRETDNTSMALAPDTIEEPQTAPSVDVPTETTAEAVEPAEVKPEQPVAERAVNEITTEEWDNMNAKDRKNMKKKLKKQGLEPIIQDSFDFPAPVDDLSKDDQPSLSNGVNADDKASTSKLVTAEPETRAPFVSELVPEAFAEPSIVAEAEGVQEPAVFQGEEHVSIVPEEVSHPIEDDVLPVNKELAIQPEAESTEKEPEVYFKPAAPIAEHEPAPELSATAPTVTEPLPGATPEEKAAEELPESPSKSKKKKKIRTQQPPQEEPTPVEPTTVLAEDTTIDSAPTPQAEKEAFNAWTDPVVSIETPAATPVDLPVEQSSTAVEDPLQPSTELSQDAPVESSVDADTVDADTFDAWAQPDTVANTDVPDQEQDKHAKTAEQLSELSNAPMQEDAVSSKSKKNKKKKKGTKTDDEPVTEPQDSKSQGKSLEEPEKATYDLTEPSVPAADTKPETIDNAQADEATSSKSAVSTPKHDGGQAAKSVKKSRADKPVLAAPVPNSRELDDLDDVPYSPSSGNQSPSTGDVRKDRQGYFPSSLRTFPGAAGISAFKRMWGFQDQARAQNRMREALPDVARPSSETQPDTVSAEKSKVAEAKPGVPIVEVDSDKAAANKLLTSSDSHISEPLFSQGDALVEESQATTIELEPSQGAEPQNATVHVSDDVPDKGRSTAVEQPVVKTEDEPVRPTEIALEAPREILDGAIEGEDVKSVENPSIEIISNTTPAVEGKSDDTAEDKPMEMTNDDVEKPAEAKPELVTEEEPDKTAEAEDTKTAEEATGDNTEADASGSKKMAKKNKKKKKNQAGQDETTEHENDSAQQDQAIQEPPIEEVIHVSNGVDNQALASESVAEASRDIPEELSAAEPGAKSDDTTEGKVVDAQPEVKPEIKGKSTGTEALNRSQTDDKPVEGEAKEEDKIDDEPTQIQSKEEPPMSEKPENTPEAQPEENPEDKLQGSDQLPEAEATKQPQNDHKLMEPENQASSETNHSAAQAEDGPTNPEAQLLPQIDDKSQVEAEESQQMDGKPIESHAQETLHTDDKTAENETKESDSDVKLPQAEALKENDKLVQPEVVEQTQTDDKPTQVEVIDDNTVGSEAKYPSSSEKQANEAISEEPPQAARDVIAMPSVDDILPPATLKAGSPKAGSVAMKIKEAESKALRQAEGAAAAKDNAEIEALLEKQSRRGGRLLKKDQKRLATLQENVAQRTEAQAARDPPPQAAQEPTNSTSADVDVQKPSEDTAPVNEATVTTERQIDISETQPTETSGEAETVGAGLLNEATEILTDVPSEKKPMDDETTTDTAPAAEPQEKTVVDNEVMEPEISKKSEKKQKRKSVSFSENGGSQDPATENTDTRILATEPEQLDQTVVNTEDTPAQAELVPEEAPATQDMPQVLAPEDAPVDVQSSDAEETEAPPLKNPEVPLAENTTAESQAEGPSDVTLDKAESEPASEKKSKKKRKKKKDTSTDEPEKQPEAESSNEATSESTSKVSDDAKDSIGQEASSGTPNPTDPVDDETAEASPLPLGSEAANISSEILPTNNEQAQPADGEKPVEISPCQKPASAIEASEAPGAVVPEQTPTEQPVVPNIEEPESPAKLSKKDKKKKKKKADKKKAALEEESKEPKSEPTTSFEKGEVEVERETAEHTAEDPKVTRDETSEQTDSKETPKGDIILEGEIATPANEAKVPDTGNSGELPSEEPASPEDERGGFSLSQSQTDQKNKAKDSDFEIVQDIKTNHPTQPETVRQDAAAAVVDEAQSQGSSEGTQRQEDKTVAVHLDPPVEPETKLESGLGLGKEKEKLDDDEEFAGLSKKQIKKLKKARALATPESSVEAEMPKESGTSLEEAATPATEAGTESEPTPQTCAESAAETTTGAEQELGYETMNDPLPDIEETVPIIEPDFEAELESKTENQSLDNTDIQPATERADDEPDVDADLQTRQPKSDGQTTSEQDIIVPVPEVDSGDNLTDVPDKSSSTNLPAEHQVVKKPDSSRVEDATEPPQMLGEPAENIQDSRSIIEVETGPIIPDKLEQTDVTTEDIPSSSPDMAEKTTEAQIPMEAELPKPVEINQPLEEVLTDAPAESMDENAPEKAMQSPHEPILQSLGDPTQSSNHETVELEAISEPAAPVETTPACDTQPSSTDATKLAEQTPLDLLPSSDLFSSTPVLPADPSSPQQRVSEPTEPESTERDLSITIDETGPSSVAPDIVTSEDTVIPDTQTVPVSEESDKSVESNVEKQLEETSQPHEPNSVLQPVVTGSLMAPVDSPLNEKPIEDTSPSSYPTTDVASVPEPEQAPEEETEANQDISNEAAIDKAREESVQLTKEKPAVPVVERQQQPVSHDHPLDSSTSQSDRQVTDDRYNEKAQFFKEDAEREVFEESGPSETNVQEEPEATQDTVLPQIESMTEDIVPDTAALPDFSANPSSELVDTPGINEPEKSERGENEFTTEEWQSLAGKEKKNIKKKLKRKGLDLIIQDSFQPTTSGSEALPETDTEPELVLTQPEDLTARVTEAEAQTEKSQEASVNKTSDKFASSPSDSNFVGTKEDLENDATREQAEPTSQTTAGQKNIPTESPPSQETTLVTEVKSDKQEIAEGHVVSPSEGKDKETAELEGKDEAEVPVTVKTPDEFEMPPFFEEPQHRSGSQQDLPVPSTAKNETSQEAETDVTPVELISETKAEPPTSHEPGYRVTTPPPAIEVPESQHPERLSPKSITETGGARETHADIIAGSGSGESTAPSNQTPVVQESFVAEERSELSPKKSKKTAKSRKSGPSEAKTQAPGGETSNEVGNDVQQETRPSVEDTQKLEKNDKGQDQPDNIMTYLPASQMPPSVEVVHPALDTRDTLQKHEGQKENQEATPTIDDTNSQILDEMAPASRNLEAAEHTQIQPEESTTEKREPTSDATGEGRENTVATLDAHAEGRPGETERNANIVPSEDKKQKKRAKKNSGTAGAEVTDSNNGRLSLESIQISDEQQDKLKPADMSTVDRFGQQTQDELLEPPKPDKDNSPRNVSEKSTSGLPTSTSKTTFEDIVKEKPGNDVSKPIKSPGRPSKSKTTAQPEGIASSIFSMASSFFSQKDKKKRKGEITGSPGSGPASPIEEGRETQHMPSQPSKSEVRSTPNDVLVEHSQPNKQGFTFSTPETPKQFDQVREPVTLVEQDAVERDSSPASKIDGKNGMKIDTIQPSKDSVTMDASTNLKETVPVVDRTPNTAGDGLKAEQAAEKAETATRQPAEQEPNTVQDPPKQSSKKDKKKKKREQKKAEDEAKTTGEALTVTPSYSTATDQPMESNHDTKPLGFSTLPPNPEVSMQPTSDMPQSADFSQLGAEDIKQQGHELQMNKQDLEKPEPDSPIGSTTNGDAKLEDEDGQTSSAVKQPQSIVEGPSIAHVSSTTLESRENAAVDLDTPTKAKDLLMIVEPPLASPVDESMAQPAVPHVPESQATGHLPLDPQSTSAIPIQVDNVNTTSDSYLSKREKKKAKLALEKELAKDHQASDTPDAESFQASKPKEPGAQGNQSPSTPDNTLKLKKTAIKANDQDIEGGTEPVEEKGLKKGKKAQRETGSPIITPGDRKLGAPSVVEPTQPVTVPGQDRTKAESDLATIVEPSGKESLPKAVSDIFTSGPDALTESPMTAAPVAIPQEPGVILPEEKSHMLPLPPQDTHMSTDDRSSKPALAPSPSFKNDTTRAGVGFDDAPTASTKEKKKRRKGSEQAMSPPESVPHVSPGVLTETDTRPAKTQKSVGDRTATVGDKRPGKPETSIFARVTAAAAAAWGTKKASDKTMKEQAQDERKDGEGRSADRDSTQDERGERGSTDRKTTTKADSYDIKPPTTETTKETGNESKDNGRNATGDLTNEIKTPEKRLKSSKGTKSARQSADEPKQPERQGGTARSHGSTRDAPVKYEQDDKNKLRRSRPDDLDDVESPVLGRGDSELSRGSPQKLLRRDSGVDEPRGGLLREDSTTITPTLGMESDISDILRSPSRLLEPVLEVPEAEMESTRGAFSPPPQVRRNSGPVGDASSFQRRSRRLSEESRRDSVAGERPTLRRSKPRSPEPFRDSGIETEGWEHPQPILDRTVMQTPEPKPERRLRRSPRGTPVLREPTVPGPTPEPEKKKQYGILTPVGATVTAGAGAGLASTLSRSGPGPSTSSSTPTRTPTPGSNSNSNPAASYAGQRSFSDNASPIRRSTPRLESAGRRAVSNTSLSRRRTPEPLNSRPESPGINRSSGTPTPPLRRADKRMSGDLRSIRQQNNTATATVTAPVSSTPVANEGRARATKDMADVYDGFGEGRIGSPRSPTRPHSMRRRQSMQVLELENRVEQLMAENRMLTEARAMAETSLSQRAANSLAERDSEIDNLKQSLQFLQNEVSRLTEVNDGLASANTELANKDTGRVADLESRNAVVARELEEARRVKGTTEQSLEEKDAEIADLRAQLDTAKEKIRELQRQILEAKAHDDHFLNIRDEDHFDHRCQQLCSHVQQWVLRFSKFSDMRACRLTNEINDEKTIDRLDNAVLDGSDVDVYLRDRVKRRDIFMSMTMNMIWEFVFTRYLFGMDREQRQKLKSLEKLLTEVGPPEAVRQWRAVTLTLLAKRESFKRQRDLDTEAVVQAIFQTLCKILPPPTNLEDQIQSQLRRVMREAVGLSIEMRTQKAEYMMLPPLRPEYDADGELTATVQFNASMMNERSGSITTSNEDLEAQGAIVRVVLFPLVVKKGDDNGKGDEEIVVCPAQVLVPRSRLFPGASDGGSTSIGARSHISLVTETMGQTEVDY
ncbi:hypothetical protein FVEN_g3307 [Fusarium venenatum]|nr:hypothetical protein FVEN_g3307 [Fusarium venenatum]